MKELRYSSNKENHKTGRTDPCLCGSGEKYKKCCLPCKSKPGESRRRSGERINSTTSFEE